MRVLENTPIGGTKLFPSPTGFDQKRKRDPFHEHPIFDLLWQTEERIEDGLKTGNIRNYQKRFEQLLNNTGGPNKGNFSIQRSEKNEKKIHTISVPTPRYQQPQTRYIASCTLHPLFITRSNNTRRAGPTLINVSRMANKATLSEIQTKLSIISLPCRDHYQK